MIKFGLQYWIHVLFLYICYVVWGLVFVKLFSYIFKKMVRWVIILKRKNIISIGGMKKKNFLDLIKGWKMSWILILLVLITVPLNCNLEYVLRASALHFSHLTVYKNALMQLHYQISRIISNLQAKQILRIRTRGEWLEEEKKTAGSRVGHHAP